MKTYLALQHAETTLKDVHDGIVHALLAVDDLVIMNTSHHKCRTVIRALALPLVNRLLRIPPLLTRQLLLLLRHQPQELNMSAREQIKPSIHINNPLPRLGSNPPKQLPEHPLLLFLTLILLLLLLLPLPKPHIRPRVLGRLIRRIQPNPLLHLLPNLLLLLRRAIPFLPLQHLFQILDEMRPRAQQHPPHQIRGADTRRALHHLEPIRRLHKPVAVLPGAIGRDVVPVHHVLAPEMADPVQLRDVGRVGDRLGHPPAGVRGEQTLAQRHDGGPLVLEDGFVRVHADVQLGAELAGLHDGAGVTMVEEVEAAVDPETAFEKGGGGGTRGVDGVGGGHFWCLSMN